MDGGVGSEGQVVIGSGGAWCSSKIERRLMYQSLIEM